MNVPESENNVNPPIETNVHLYPIQNSYHVHNTNKENSNENHGLTDVEKPTRNHIKTYNHQSSIGERKLDNLNGFAHSNNRKETLLVIGLSNEDEADGEVQTSSNNSPFHSAAEDVGTDGDHDRDPLLIKSPPRQSVFHQFLSANKRSKAANKICKQQQQNVENSKNQCDSSMEPYPTEDDLENYDDEEAKPLPQRGRCSVGIFLAAVSCIFFATSALIVKISNLHPMELLCVRGLLQAIFISPIVISSGNSFLGPNGSRALLLSRAVLGAVSLVMSFASIHLIPLADAATCIFTSPVFVSLFACICLGEVCSWFDVTMIALTLVGVILVSQPSFNFITTGSWTSIVGTVCGLAAAMLTALAFIVLRQLKHVHYSVTVLWFSTILAGFGAVLTIALDGFTVPRDLSNILECLGIGVCGFLGQILLTKALQIENAGPCAVARTLDIVLAFFYQITLLHDTPDWYSYLGSFLVVSCVLLTAFRRWYKEKFQVVQSTRRYENKTPSQNNRNCNYSRAMS